MKDITKIIISLVLAASLTGCVGADIAHNDAPIDERTEVREPIELMRGKKILFVAVPNFRDGELVIPKNVFAKEGAEISYASLKKGDFVGNEGTTVTADYALDEVEVNDFDAIIFIGGPGMTKELENEELRALAKKAMEAENLTAAICIAPAMLGDAGLLKGKRATVFPTGRGYLIEGGAQYTGQPVERDGKLITADGPESAAAFANEIINYFK